MKKLTTVLAALCLALCLFPAPALAAGITYELEDPGMSITLPEGLVVFTDMTDDELAEYGFTMDSLRQLFVNDSLRIDAMDADFTYEFVVTSMDSSIGFLSELGDALFDYLVSTMVDGIESMGFTCTDTDIYMHEQAKFVKMHHNHMLGETVIYSVQYATVYNGKHVNVTLHSLTGEQEALAAEAVDSIHFSADPPEEETPVQTPLRTEAFKYTDGKTGMSFTVPENWVERENGKTDGRISIYFDSTLDTETTIAFGSFSYDENNEYCAEFTPMERLLLKHGAMQELFTQADVAEILDVDKDEITTITLGGRKYYRTDTEKPNYDYGFPITVPMTFLFHYEGGVGYMFYLTSFSGLGEKDFLSLVESAEYPTGNGTGLTSNGLFAIFCAIAIAADTLPIVICRFAIKRRPLARRRAACGAIIYGVCTTAAVGAALYIAGGIPWWSVVLLPWSWVNYRIMISGRRAAGDGRGPRSGAGSCICPACGATLEPWDLFCGSCGERVAQEPAKSMWEE